VIAIDGSEGEGGGQILRSALALSLVTGKPFDIHSIRAGRRIPGLLRQHLTCVQAASRVGSARCEGAEAGSGELQFHPGPVRSGRYRFAVGTAGSTSLVLQTLLPALLCADGPSHVQIEGGTHNPAAPPFDFLKAVFAPLLERMGPTVRVRLERPGFAPAGGGCITAEIEPVPALTSIDLMERGAISGRRAEIWLAHLPDSIGKREATVLARRLGWPASAVTVRRFDGARGPGNVVMARVESEHVTELFSAVGQRGVRAEKVAGDAADQVRDYLAGGAPVGRRLADQLLLPLALAGGGRFRTGPLSLHTRTNMAVIERFLPVRIEHADDAITVVPTHGESGAARMAASGSERCP
jgi:RNA 3'-terminal phosphate cyclase (ATP)